MGACVRYLLLLRQVAQRLQKQVRAPVLLRGAAQVRLEAPQRLAAAVEGGGKVAEGVAHGNPAGEPA